MQKILLTGATGFVGSHLVKALVELGMDVSCLVRPNSTLDPLSFHYPEIHFYPIESTYESILKALSEARPECVIHVSGYACGLHEATDLDPIMQSNFQMPLYLLEAMNAVECRYLVNTGTFWEFYHSSTFVPVSLYAAMKYAFQNVIDYYVSAHHFSAITLRLGDVYGPRDSRNKVIPSLLRSSLSGTCLDMTEGEQLMFPIYIEDVVSAYLVALKAVLSLGQVHLIRDVFPERPLTLKEVVSVFDSVLPHPLRINWGKLPYRSRTIMTWKKPVEYLEGWAPRVSLQEGLHCLL
jgi:nucleoside-diphosphate-sugar epimerase